MNSIKNCAKFENGKRYYPISQHYRERFGEKVYKVSVSVAKSCPNREGFQGMNVCIFCDEWGSAAYHQFSDLPILKQIQINREAIRKRYKAKKFLIYFQAYTNTFGDFSGLKTLYDKALNETDVVGLVVGTRPDCLPKRILNKFNELSKEQYLSVELGVQTFDDDQLNFLSRGHDSITSIKAIQKLKSLQNINICVHLMFGLPNETDRQIQETAQFLSELGVNGVKLHNLHVLRNTELEKLFKESKFFPIKLEEYARRVAIFLENLSPKITVHRLAAVASRWDQLVAPHWTREKMRPTQFIDDYLEKNQIWQGQKF